MNRFRRKAFSLFELMTVLTISSMLVAVLLSVTVGIARTTKTTSQRFPYDASAFVFQRQLQTEFAASRDIYPEKYKLTVEGYFGSSSRGSRHGPTKIMYEVKDVGGEFWLIRREIDLLGIAPDNQTVNVVCRNFSHFEYVTAGDVSNSPPQFHLILHKQKSVDEGPSITVRWFEAVLIRHGGGE